MSDCFQQVRRVASLPVCSRPSAFMGFDGFVDTIAHLSHGEGMNFNSMASFGSFLLGRLENNCSLEVRRNVRKMGGNMPICANALAVMGVPVACVGAMGSGLVDPAFAGMHTLCSLHTVALPGECLALEFSDSKLFLADLSGPKAMSWDGILESVGKETLVQLAGASALLGMFNWGELPNVQHIWEGFARDILPDIGCNCHTAVFDLSDCSGRSAGAIHAALDVMALFRAHMRVVLSANDNEILSIARALGDNGCDHIASGMAVLATGAIDMLVHHSLTYARVFDENGTATVNGIHIDKPVLVTGGGDHFNAGLCLGLLADLDGSDSALLGNTVSRLYVSTGESPSLDDVLNEIEVNTVTL